MHIASNIIQAIGNTPLVQLRKVVPPDHSRVLVKLEGANPTGSMKDRMAKAMIEGAEADGRLQPGGTVVESTGGSTGASLAMVCAAEGYRLRIVTSDAFSPGKRDHMRALGAELTLVSSYNGSFTRELFVTMNEVARQMGEEPGSYWTHQMNNEDQVAGYHALGDEIWAQTGGQIDAFVHVVGTGGSIRGSSTALRRYDSKLRVVAVEPAESPVLSGGEPGAHGIEGIGAGYIVPLWDPILVDDILTVSTDEAKEMAQRLAREEGIFAGISSGANIVAALRVAEQLPQVATVVTLLIDSGLKYLSTDLYKET